MTQVAEQLTHTYRPRGGVIKLLECRSREVLLAGPAGTGKSMGALFKLHLLALMNPGSRFLMVRKTLKSLTSTGLVTFQEKVAHQALLTGDVKFHGGSTKEPAAWKYSNGSTIVVGGMDDPTKIMSSEYDCIYIQESTELSEDEWEKATTRLRNGKITFQQIIADCNPDAPTHWLRQRCDTGRTTEILSRHEDNPLLFDDDGNITPFGREYMDILDNLTGARYLRLRKGLWVAAEGLVYEEDYDPNHHIIDQAPMPVNWMRYWSVDFGYVHPFVCQMWAVDPDGRMYLYREIFHTKRTVDMHCRDILRAVADLPPGVEEATARPSQWIWREPKPRVLVADHHAENRAVLERDLGMGVTPAPKGVTEGIQVVQARLRKQGDGKARIFFMRDAVLEVDPELRRLNKPACTIEEITSYVWHKPNGTTIKPKEVPVKDMDDGCLIAGTLVETMYGAVPIEDIRAGDTVMTRAGMRSVLAAGMTSSASKVVVVELSSGKTLSGTGNHPVWVSGEGWKRLDALRYGDTIEAWQSPSSSTESTSAATPTLSSGRTASITRPAAETGSSASVTSTRRSGRLRTARFLKATRSITSTSTQTTTTSATWPASQRTSTTRLTLSAEASGAVHQRPRPSWSVWALKPRSGTAPTLGGSGTPSMPVLKASVVALSAQASVSNAAASTPPFSRPSRTGSAPTSANQLGDGPAGSMTSSAGVSSAGRTSQSTGTSRSPTAGPIVVGLRELPARAPVFNLTVEGVPEFYANGMLVHNCDAMRYMANELDAGRPRIRSMNG